MAQSAAVVASGPSVSMTQVPEVAGRASSMSTPWARPAPVLVTVMTKPAVSPALIGIGIGGLGDAYVGALHDDESDASPAPSLLEV